MGEFWQSRPENPELQVQDGGLPQAPLPEQLLGQVAVTAFE